MIPTTGITKLSETDQLSLTKDALYQLQIENIQLRRLLAEEERKSEQYSTWWRDDKKKLETLEELVAEYESNHKC